MLFYSFLHLTHFAAVELNSLTQRAVVCVRAPAVRPPHTAALLIYFHNLLFLINEEVFHF